MEQQMIKSKGIITTLVLVFGAVFLILLGGLFGFILLQLRQANQKIVWNEALEIAEAGANYYRWHLAHFPTDYCDGHELGSDNCSAPPYGPFEHTYYEDPEEKILLGKFSLKITPPSACSYTTRIESTGWTDKYPEIKRTLLTRYGKPSLAQYVYLTNGNVWFKGEETIKGKIHSNRGIRMDAKTSSLVTSAKKTYICGSETGCSYSNCNVPCQIVGWKCECPGVWGNAGGETLYSCETANLWECLVPAVDFDRIIPSFLELKSIAQSSGTYRGDSGSRGYHLVFGTDANGGYFDLYKVTKLGGFVRGWGWHWGFFGWGWAREREEIEKETLLLQNQRLTPDCNIIFLEDKLWVDGEIDGRVTVVAARPEIWWLQELNIIINNNLTYKNKDGSSILGLISQNNIFIPLHSPDNLTIDAVLLAREGEFSRRYYDSFSKDTYLRDQLNIYGSIITNTSTWRWWGGWWWGGWRWRSDSGEIVSGYQNVEITYDSHITYDPPPYFLTSGEYEFLSWEEIE